MADGQNLSGMGGIGSDDCRVGLGSSDPIVNISTPSSNCNKEKNIVFVAFPKKHICSFKEWVWFICILNSRYGEMECMVNMLSFLRQLRRDRELDIYEGEYLTAIF